MVDQLDSAVKLGSAARDLGLHAESTSKTLQADQQKARSQETAGKADQVANVKRNEELTQKLAVDLRCGEKPCGSFTPIRFYEDKREKEIPYGCIKSAVFNVLGTEKCDSPSGLCLEFQTMAIEYTGRQWWWKTAEGEVRCQENQECKRFYNQLRQSLQAQNAKTFQD